MELKMIAERLGIETYPEEMNGYVARIEERKDELCSLALIEKLQEKFKLFGTYYDLVVEAWKDMEKSADKRAWLDVACLYFKDSDLYHTRRCPYPKPDNTPSGDFYPLFILLPCVERAHDKYLERGFSDEEVQDLFQEFAVCLELTETQYLHRPGLIAGYFDWLNLYIHTTIFKYGCLNFEFRKQNAFSVVLRNKKTGELMPLAKDMKYHACGLPLGSAGAKEEEGSFTPTFTETDDAFIGHPTVEWRVSKETRTYPKAEWEVFAQYPDRLIGIHIPRKTNFSPEAVSAALEGARKIAKERYPEFEPKSFFCASWLLEPALNEILGDKAKISSFSSRFTRFPNIVSGGRSVFGYVFPAGWKDYSTLPEDSSLQRGLKAHYLAGKFVYDFSGYIPF